MKEPISVGIAIRRWPIYLTKREGQTRGIGRKIQVLITPHREFLFRKGPNLHGKAGGVEQINPSARPSIAAVILG
jgi:hypothetical protein